jgi:hypothetical protein
MRPDERAPEPTGGDGVDAEFGQEGNGGFVKGISWRDPDVGFYTFTGEDFGAEAELFLLHRGQEGSKFALLSKCDQAAVLCNVEVLISVHGDGPAEILPSADTLPEVSDRRVGLENGVLIVGDDSENGLDVVMNQDGFDLRPDVPAHGGTNVIETEDEQFFTLLLHQGECRVFQFSFGEAVWRAR